MYACFQLEFAKECADALKKITPFTREFFKLVKSKPLPEYPPFISYSDDDVSVYVKKQKKEYISELISGLSELLPFLYKNIIEKLFAELQDLVHTAIFQAKSDKTFAVTITQMHNLMEEVVNSALEPRLVNHLFLNLANHLDAYVSNSFMKNASTHVNLDKAIHMKMFVSYLENWFDESGIQVYEPSKIKGEEEQKVTLFPFSRQFADASILSDASLLADDSFKSSVAPSLSVKQIGFMFANFINEKYVVLLHGNIF